MFRIGEQLSHIRKSWSQITAWGFYLHGPTESVWFFFWLLGFTTTTTIKCISTSGDLDPRTSSLTLYLIDGFKIDPFTLLLHM